MELELYHLRNLCAVAKVGSLNRAAAQLELPQPALSRQVRRLEETLGGELFDRDQRGVRLTALGHLVIDYAETIIDVCDDLGRDFESHRLNRNRTLRVGWSTSTISDLLLQCLRSLRPWEELEIVMGESTAQVIEWLNSGELDLALFDEQSTFPVPMDDSVRQIPLVEDPVFVSLPADHRLASAPAVPMAELAGEQWIIGSGRDGCQSFLRRLCEPFGFAPKMTHDIPVLGPREEVVRCQGSVTFVQAMRPEQPGVVRRPLADLSLFTHHSLAYRTDSAVASQAPLLGWLFTDLYWARTRARPSYNDWLMRHQARPESNTLVAAARQLACVAG